MTTLPSKPKFGDTCNGCGLCCLAEQCPVSIDLFGEAQTCPALEFDEGRFWCGLMRHPDRYGAPIPPGMNAPQFYREWIGGDVGCDSDGEDADEMMADALEVGMPLKLVGQYLLRVYHHSIWQVWVVEEDSTGHYRPYLDERSAEAAFNALQSEADVIRFLPQKTPGDDR